MSGECPVCYNSYYARAQDGGIVQPITLPCSPLHILCTACLAHLRSPHCPFCRAQLPAILAPPPSNAPPYSSDEEEMDSDSTVPEAYAEARRRSMAPSPSPPPLPLRYNTRLAAPAAAPPRRRSARLQSMYEARPAQDAYRVTRRHRRSPERAAAQPEAPTWDPYASWTGTGYGFAPPQYQTALSPPQYRTHAMPLYGTYGTYGSHGTYGGYSGHGSQQPRDPAGPLSRPYRPSPRREGEGQGRRSARRGSRYDPVTDPDFFRRQR